MTRANIAKALAEHHVRFLNLEFTDMMGAIKTVRAPISQQDRALDGDILFDGSALEGTSRTEETDMVLQPDLETFRLYTSPEPNGETPYARLVCDIHTPDGTPFEGCPRTLLKRAVREASDLGFTMTAGLEVEFFMFETGENGSVSVRPADASGYFDVAPTDRGEQVLEHIVEALERLGLQVAASHHEVAAGQHEIDLQPEEVVRCADNLSTLRFVARKVAVEHGMHATFMPKPLHDEGGSGLHSTQILLARGKNAFSAPATAGRLSPTARCYIGGLLRHARGFAAITNPLINSYKRLTPGFEAPTEVFWSERNVSPLIRVPERPAAETCIEMRLPDPACNPYLAFAVMLHAGLDGIKNTLDPGDPVNKDVPQMSHRERRRLRIDPLPTDLHQAVTYLEKDPVVQEALGDYLYHQYVRAKRAEWTEYMSFVHPWERDRYLMAY